MELEQVLHMNSGVGQTSYATNSSLQREVISIVRPMLEESIKVYCDKVLPKCLRIADLGCSSGPNTLTVVSNIFDIIEASSQSLNINTPTFQVFLNDLPGNDFNAVFQSLSSFYEKLKIEKGDKFGPCFITAMPGSFYGRLFPDNSMHIVHSSYSLQWLSKVPKGLVDDQTGEAHNKGNIYISKTSPAMVFKSYLDQFQIDFTNFLRYRSEEMVSGGIMILTFLGSIQSHSPKSIYEILGRTLNGMVKENIIEAKCLDNYNVPLYWPSAREVKSLIEKEGSFCIQKLNTFEIAWDAGFTTIEHTIYNNEKHKSLGKYVSDYIRAVMEPILVKQFGETIMDELFNRFSHKVNESMANENWNYVNLFISLTKN
ncbi:S-adenosyl-L-methionine:benzoic acid/salicylic acid carboxyl methyltransferase 1-like [Cannabis sativa]|uniref:S-adenosyl-L-methionine:benzoic acid/salicylic acid carboxyl methyltransferase 1-like n=1 Tax=Cannabis sativa TaxID=3483 RepID=UPI0029CA6906|nr:S-adenosyl-L-methionine:benzoic acid/salicylic acid carboxyl methyltransferase 1-like [Cannabis sativa]